MHLFDLKDNIVIFSPQALALKPFAALWKRDRTKDKKVAVAELSYIFYYCDYRADFAAIVDDETREQQILEVIDLPAKWKKDSKIQDAIDLYHKLQESLAIQSLKAARVAVDKVNQFLLTVDLKEKDANGRLLYKPKDIDDSVAKIHTRLEQLNKVEEEVQKQIEAKIDMQGTMVASEFEDGIPE